jgi:hypothetical protein
MSAFDLNALFLALDSRREARGLSWTQVAREINAPYASMALRPISTSTLTGLRERSVVEADGVLQMLIWLDRTPESFVPGYGYVEGEAFRLARVGPGQILRFDARAVHAALDRRRREKRLTWSEVANEIGGLRASGLTRLARGGRVSFPGIMSIAAWLELPAAALTHASDS